MDPYSGKLISIPARGLECKHLDSFDLKYYLAYNYYNQNNYGLLFPLWIIGNRN